MSIAFSLLSMVLSIVVLLVLWGRRANDRVVAEKMRADLEAFRRWRRGEESPKERP